MILACCISQIYSIQKYCHPLWPRAYHAISTIDTCTIGELTNTTYCGCKDFQVTTETPTEGTSFQSTTIMSSSSSSAIAIPYGYVIDTKNYIYNAKSAQVQSDFDSKL